MIARKISIISILATLLLFNLAFILPVYGGDVLEITRIDVPPGTVAVGEAVPIVVHVGYNYGNLTHKFTLIIYDRDGNTYLAEVESPPLSGDGVYNFPPITITPYETGEWRLKAITVGHTAGASSEKFFSIMVEGGGEPEVEITQIQYVEPPDSIAVAESTTVMVTIRYQNLEGGTTLTVNIRDRDTGSNVGRKEAALSGDGEHIFPIVLRPTRTGDWQLEVTVAPWDREWITIKVVEAGAEEEPGGFNFSIIVMPDVITLEPGGSISCTVDVALVNGPAEEVRLSYNISARVMGLGTDFDPISGTPSYTSTLNIWTTDEVPPGTYTIYIVGFGEHTGVSKSTTVTLIISLEGQQPPLPPSGGFSTDWAIGALWLSPSNPQPSDQVIFHAEVLAITSDRGFPQRVGVAVYLNEQLIGGGPILEPQEGVAITISTNTPWTAVAGTHTVAFVADPRSLYNDPNIENNREEISFTVGEGSAPSGGFDFSITVRPESQSLRPEGSIYYDVYVDLETGSSETVTLTISGLPEDATYAFDPPIGEPLYQSRVTIYVPEYTAVGASILTGTYPLTITAEGGGITRTATTTLIIEATGEATIMQPTSTPESTPTVTTQTPGGKQGLKEAINKRNRIFLGLIIIVIAAIALAAYYMGKARKPKSEPTSKSSVDTNTSARALNG